MCGFASAAAGYLQRVRAVCGATVKMSAASPAAIIAYARHWRELPGFKSPVRRLGNENNRSIRERSIRERELRMRRQP